MKRTKFHVNVAIKLHRICTCKNKNMRELLLCQMASLHVKNNLKIYKKCRKGGGVNAKRAVEKQGKEFIKINKKDHVTLNIILL